MGIVWIVLGLWGGEPEPRPARFGDFAAYWTAGRCFWQRQDLYDPDVLAAFEERHDLAQTFVIWNPPWILPLLAPFAALPFAAGAIAWCGMNVVLVLVAASLVATRIGRPGFWAWVLSITFVPVGICIGISQLAVLVLAGAVLYVAALARGRPRLAGAALVLCTFKPHLVALLWIAAALAGPLRERLRVLAGMVLTVTALTVVTLVWHPRVWLDYRRALADPPGTPLTDYYSATLGMWLRRLPAVVPENWTSKLPAAIRDRAQAAHPKDQLLPIWVQFLPLLVVGAGFGVLGALGRLEPGSPHVVGAALLLSQLALPYGWHYDQALLLPVYLWLWSRCLAEAGSRGVRRGLLVGLVALEVGQAAMLIMKVPEADHVVWPFWLGLLAVLSRLMRH